MDKISKYVSYIEATKSDTAIRKGIDNTPNDVQLKAMIAVATHIFDPCREYCGGPLEATSFLRVHDLNVAVGGAKDSQHEKGEAIDMDCDKYGNGTNLKLFLFIKNNLVFDQLIFEFGTDTHPEWVHCSYIDELVKGRKNRMQVLRAYKRPDGKTEYVPYS